MRFGRLNGYVTRLTNGEVWITVVLDTGTDIATVRDEPVPRPLLDREPAWLADQLVQETLGTDLAEAGWEVIGQGEPEAAEPGDMIARSPTWIVRKT